MLSYAVLTLWESGARGGLGLRSLKGWKGLRGRRSRSLPLRHCDLPGGWYREISCYTNQSIIIYLIITTAFIFTSSKLSLAFPHAVYHYSLQDGHLGDADR